MPVRTFEQYHKRLLGMQPNVYVGGKVIDRSSPLIDSGLYVMWQTFDCAHDEKYREFCTVTSHLTGETINRFTHIHQTEDDPLKKQKATKPLLHKVGGCIQWYMRIDILDILSVVTYKTDRALGTTYDESFLKYLVWCQEHDIVANCAQMGAKDGRIERPSEQADPDMYLRIMETRPDGTVVGGVKSCNSSAPYADEIIVTPIRFIGPFDKDYAVSFMIPADWEGVKLATLPGVRHKRSYIDASIAHVGNMGLLTIFDDVFVPNDQIFMSGHADSRQTSYAGFLALIFAYFHRHSYTGCKPATSGALASMPALAAEYNGIEKQSYVKGRLVHTIGITEVVFACGVASAIRGQKSPFGTYIPDGILTDAGRKLASEEIYNGDKALADLASGLTATIPMEAEHYPDEVGELLNRYIMRNPDISAENVHGYFRMIGDQVLSEFGDSMIVAGLHGGGPPIVEEVAMTSRYPLEELKGITKYLADIKSEILVSDRRYVTPRKMLEEFTKYTK